MRGLYLPRSSHSDRYGLLLHFSISTPSFEAAIWRVSVPEEKQIRPVPWEPECLFRGRLAIDNLGECLLQSLRDDHGVHAETLLAAAGVLAGFAAQHAALIDGARATSQAGAVPKGSVLLLGTKSGEQFITGSGIIKFLFDQKLSLWRLANTHIIEAGIPEADIPDARGIVKHVTEALGHAGFGTIRVINEHQPRTPLHQLLKLLWPQMLEVIQRPLPKAVPVAEPSLDPIYWPAIASIAATRFIVKAKDTLDPRLSYTILMESAVIAAKYAPETIDPGKWRFEARNGDLAVFRLAI